MGQSLVWLILACTLFLAENCLPTRRAASLQWRCQLDRLTGYCQVFEVWSGQGRLSAWPCIRLTCSRRQQPAIFATPSLDPSSICRKGRHGHSQRWRTWVHFGPLPVKAYDQRGVTVRFLPAIRWSSVGGAARRASRAVAGPNEPEILRCGVLKGYRWIPTHVKLAQTFARMCSWWSKGQLRYKGLCTWLFRDLWFYTVDRRIIKEIIYINMYCAGL